MSSRPALGIQRSEHLGLIRARVWLIHLAVLGVFFVPVTESIVFWTIIGYFLRVFAWEVGSHRYFSHRSFRTSRVFQAVLAILAAAGGQRGPLWWAEKHRAHHRHSDMAMDPHSPVLHGFWYAHIGWILRNGNCDTDLDAVSDLARFSELVWINRFHYVFAYGLLLLIFALGQWTTAFGANGLGLSAVVWVFFVATLAALHATFAVNTVTHGLHGGPLHRRRFVTSDSSTNCWLLAIPTLGASWHNNHHRYMNAARAGFYWWELDLGYLALRGLAVLGIVWNLHPVPETVLAEGRQSANLAPR